MEKLYKIGEVAKLCDISIKTLRFYEDEKLIKPVKVDIYSGYRFYDDNSILDIYRVMFLRNVGFSIKEIREFNNESISQKIEDLEQQIARLKDNKKMLFFLTKQKGEKIMKNFINDPAAIGKWTCIASAKDKKEYLNGKYEKVNADTFIKTLYFLPNGEGYWIFERWTKGMLLHFRGDVYKYEIIDNKLFLDVVYNGEPEMTLVFEKQDSNKYTEEKIAIRDNTDLPFVMDKKVLGLWEVVDLISIKEKANFKPNKNNTYPNLYLKAATFNENGDVIFELSQKTLFKNFWTKGVVLDKKESLVSNYLIKTIDGETYLFMDWKSGDYIYQGDITCCYVFKKFTSKA